jgi:hypothetical protein
VVPSNPNVFQMPALLVTDKFKAAAFKEKAALYNDGSLQIG